MTKRSVFVIMPFNKGLDDIWKIGIKETAEEMGFDCFRADDILTPGFVVDQIYDSISKADIIVGEMTGKNPNVFYEVGFAHAIGKPTILLATSQKDLTSFDTRGLRHFLHKKNAKAVGNFIRKALTNIETIEPWPTIPNGEIIYEWPYENEDPNFLWELPREKIYEPIDKNGGQTIIKLEQIGKVISVFNTKQNWNWQRDFSLMTLRKYSHFSIGDTVSIIIKAQTSGNITLKFIGDGGYLNINKGELWTDSWKTVTKSFDGAPIWEVFVIKTKVNPTREGYDPAKRGTKLMLASSIGEKDLKIKRIQIIHQKQSK